MTRLAVTGAVLLLVALGLWRMSAAAYARGEAAAVARQMVARLEAQGRVMRLAEALGRAEAERLAAEAERDGLARDLEEAARLDGDAGRVALGAGSVRRLARR